MKFHGVSIHHDNGALGAEENYKATYRKLKLLKDMGVNSIRTTHNPASPQLLDAAASLGLLVQEEAFAVSYTHLTLPTTLHECRSRWSPYH